MRTSTRWRSSPACFARHGLDPVEARRSATSSTRTVEDGTKLFERLLRHGVIMRPLGGLRRAGRGANHRGDAGGPRRSRHGSFSRRRRARTRLGSTSRVRAAPAAGSRACCAGPRRSGCSSLATFASGLGTWIAVVALTVDVYDRTGSANWVSALLVADFLPSVAIGLLLRAADRPPVAPRIMVVADLVRLGIFAALPFTNSAGQIVVLAAAAGFATGFFRPASYAGLPNLVDADDLPAANSLLRGRRVPVVDDRHGARRRHRGGLRAGPGVLDQRRRRSSSRRR